MTGQPNHATVGKASFDHIYNLDDPREYLRTLRQFEYRTPHHAQPIIRALTAARDRDPVTITDLCCSYGIIAALLRHDLTLDDLYERYTAPEMAGLTVDELADADEHFYKDHRLPDTPTVVGVDVADRAVAYALRIGLLDDGAGENLETAEPTPELARSMAATDLVTISGGVGYISTATFQRVLDCVPRDRAPWVAAFPLRTVDFDPVEALLATRGLVTERLDGTFAQRRFVSAEEQEQTIRQLEDRGIDPTGRESEGYHHAQLYLARPAEDVEAVPLSSLFDG